MKLFIAILGSLAIGLICGLTLKDRIFGVGSPEPILHSAAPSNLNPYYQVRFKSLHAANTEGYVFLIEEEIQNEYLVFPKVSENGVMRIEVQRK
jgi:hypothetical protein